ncbi:MAG: ATP-binding cassette domain-containing protein [Enterocloster sp.]|uniref:ATP-binding cassette domain-containing protein n=1 Tax=Enterocloster sp. TaxID=2719315 RepID=UPI003999BDE5
MSGGEKQLLAFASVYAMGPELYILDEPTANLDRDTIDRLHDQIVYLKSRGHTILIAEHRLYFLADLIDRAVYLRDGVVERIWSGAEFRRLAETERIALGLRTLTPTQVTLAPSRAAGDGMDCLWRVCAAGTSGSRRYFKTFLSPPARERCWPSRVTMVWEKAPFPAVCVA